MKTSEKSYTGIDCFRMIAALCIIAIHTSPLASYSELGDFILTRVIARVAVPFFFMTSGFFLISRYNYKTDKLCDFVKKTAQIYAASIVLYIPINIYNGYFKIENLLPNIIKDIVFDRTLYHLWYLPASLAGGTLAWFMVRRLGYGRAFAAAAALYLVGVFGDSYYGLIEKAPIISSFYTLWFQVSDYTRNGIFFAPVFFLLGGWIADSRTRLRQTAAWLMFLLMMLFMMAEGLILHYFQLQRHDSMYLFLVPCMYFLFQALLCFRGKRHILLRDVSLLVYIIHPMMIVLIRLTAKVFQLQPLLVENSAVHFIAVVVTSVSFSVAAAVFWRWFSCKKGFYKKRRQKDVYRAYIEINLDNLTHNVQVLCEAMPHGCKLMAVVKAEAYGHGMYEIATHLDKIGVRAFAVATIDEGIALRRYGIRGEILILGYTPTERAWELKKYDLSQTLVDYAYACRLNVQGYRVKAHIKLDTGMHRLGFDASMDAAAGKELQSILRVLSMKNLIVDGIYTHLCVADSLDEEDIIFTRRQIARFYKVINWLKKQGIIIPKTHIQSSYGLLNYPELKCSYVRAGIALYGVLSTQDAQTSLQLDLKPVLLLKAQIVLIRSIKKGESVGYGRAFVADRNSRIAILSIGYADGYPRSLSDKGQYVLINGQYAQVIGRICMDQLAVDITELSGINAGMTATLIGREGSMEIAAPAVAEQAGSITNELLSRMGMRVERIKNSVILKN